MIPVAIFNDQEDELQATGNPWALNECPFFVSVHASSTQNFWLALIPSIEYLEAVSKVGYGRL